MGEGGHPQLRDIGAESQKGFYPKDQVWGSHSGHHEWLMGVLLAIKGHDIVQEQQVLWQDQAQSLTPIGTDCC